MPLHTEQLAAVVRAGDVKRFHAMYTVQQQDVAAHSWRVAMIVRVLLEHDCNHKVLWAALTHDFGEYITGDMPADIKIRLGLQDRMQDIENGVLVTLGFIPSSGEQLSEREQLALRVADCIDGVLFCNREISLGNTGLIQVKERYMGFLDGLPLPNQWRTLVSALRFGNPVGAV